MYLFRAEISKLLDQAGKDRFTTVLCWYFNYAFKWATQDNKNSQMTNQNDMFPALYVQIIITMISIVTPHVSGIL